MAKRTPKRILKPITGAKALQILRQGIELPGGKIVCLLPPKELHIDPTYQRGVISTAVEAMIGKNFSPDALGIFHVAQRRKTLEFNVTDGQHRKTGIDIREQRGLPVPEEVCCLVTPNSTQAQEAKDFVLLNTARAVKGNSRFRAALVYHQEPEVTIKKMVEAEGFVLDFLPPGRPTDLTTTGNGIRSVTPLKLAYQRCPEYFSNALCFLRLACGDGNPWCVPTILRNGEVLQGITKFLVQQGCKEIKPLVRSYKSRFLDMACVWEEIKKETGNGYKRPGELAEWLSGAMGNGYRRRAA